MVGGASLGRAGSVIARDLDQVAVGIVEVNGGDGADGAGALDRSFNDLDPLSAEMGDDVSKRLPSLDCLCAV
jgi:hypothetical protein